MLSSRFLTLVWQFIGKNNSLPLEDFGFLLIAAISVALWLSPRVDCSISAIPSLTVGGGCRIPFQPVVLLQSRFNCEMIGRITLAALYSSTERTPRAFEMGSNKQSSVSIGASSNLVTAGDVNELVHINSEITNYSRALPCEESVYHWLRVRKKFDRPILMTKGINYL